MGVTSAAAHDRRMTTLHIEVTVNDVAAFRAGFADHTETRRRAGIRAERVRQTIDDGSLILLDLDFDTVAEAEQFLGFLEEKIWKDSPVVVGRPAVKLLEPLG